jgi:nitrite reductase/ring-hydroxylating ferredoxin subunit
MTQENWTRVCGIDDLEDDIPFQSDGPESIAIVKSEGTIHAVQNICPHGNAFLADGYVENGEIECPLHGARFCLKNGAVLSPPAQDGLKTFPIKVSGADVFVDFTCPAAAGAAG